MHKSHAWINKIHSISQCSLLGSGHILRCIFLMRGPMMRNFIICILYEILEEKPLLSWRWRQYVPPKLCLLHGSKASQRRSPQPVLESYSPYIISIVIFHVCSPDRKYLQKNVDINKPYLLHHVQIIHRTSRFWENPYRLYLTCRPRTNMTISSQLLV